jgi:DNA-binding IclR family transcriptional regulator
MLDAGRGKFEGGMTPRKFIALTGLSRATATRELTDLAGKGLLVQVGAGRSTRYELPMPGWQWQPAARGAATKHAEAGSQDGGPVLADN